MQAITGFGGMAHGPHRVQLDRAYAQRIIRITGEDNQGLIALQICQAYVKEVSKIVSYERN